MSNYFSRESGFIPLTEIITPLWPTEVDESVRPKSAWSTFADAARLHERQPGCVLGCIYCNQKWMDRNAEGERDSGILSPGDAGLTINLRVNFGAETVKEVSIPQVIDLLRQYPLYNRRGSILIGNYTDPGLNWEESCELGTRLLEDLRHAGPILFITKMPVGAESLKHLQELQQKGGKVIVIVTYSGMPKEVEPASGKHRITALQRLHDGGIPTILSMRPMIPEINGTMGNIRKVLASCAANTNAVIFGGLFVYPNTQELFAEAGHPLPPAYANHSYTVAKKNDEAIAEMIRTAAAELQVSVPIYEHTNCAVSYVMTTRYDREQWNKLAHWAMQAPEGKNDDFDHCAEICPSCQMKQCVRRSKESVETISRDIQSALIEMGLASQDAFDSGFIGIVPSEANPNLYLIRNAAFNVLQLFQVMERVGVRVDNFPSREQFILRSAEALKNHLGLGQDKIVGALQFGQEWILLVNGDLTSDDNGLASKYVRTTARCRSNVLDIAKVENTEAIKQWMVGKKYLGFLSQLSLDIERLKSEQQRS